MKINNIYICGIVLFSLLAQKAYADNISINTSKDSLYVEDNFAIDGFVLTNNNGSTGSGWSDNWTYQTGHSDGVALGDEYIYTTKGAFGISRYLLNPIKFVGSTYYVSFLFKKNSSGIFRISGTREDGVDRFGIHIREDGKLGAQAGTDYNGTVLSSESFVQNDQTYLVVAKYYYTTKPNMNISVYSVDDVVPVEEPASWDLEAEGAATGMVAIDYFRLAFTNKTICLDELKVGDTWKSVSTTDIASAFPEIEEVEQANSDVQAVYQESTTEEEAWTYEVAEAGNYQLGYAWIWVDGTDGEVDLEVKRGSKTIKSFTAESTTAPYRFETRMEDLAIGEQLSVSATPKNGAAYKLSYRLAFATPTFADLPEYNVASFGAVGDGATNDFQAVKDACAAAEDAGGGIVSFDGSKTYFIEGPENYAMFDFLNASNIKVEGNGAKIILHPKGNFIRMDNSENIHIDGFTTTYDPLPYFQGDITAMNVGDLYLDMQVDARYDAPVTGKYRQIQDIFGRSFWITLPGTKMGDGRHLSVDSTARIGEDDHAIRVFLQDHETADLQHSKNQNATDYIIPDRDYGHTNGYRDSPYCGIKRSSRVKISNILTHSVCHFGYTIGSNYGPITFSNTDMLAPHPEDMHVNWRDGWHVWANRYGIMIEDGDFDAGYTYDDIFSPHSNVPVVESTSGNIIHLQSKTGESPQKYTDKMVWQVGDLVSFWDESQMEYYGMARVTVVAETDNPRFLDITLDSTLSQVQAGMYAINEEIINRDMVIRRCTTTPKGRSTAVRQRTPVLYKDCDFQSIHFWTYCGEPWRTRPRHVKFDNCYINERSTFNVDDTWNLNIKNCTINVGQVDVNNCPRIVMDSIYFTNITGDAIKLRSASNAYVFGEYAYNGDASALEEKYNKDISSTINFSQPEVYPSYAPPFLPEMAQPQDLVYADEPFDFTGMSITNNGSGNGWGGNWNASGAGIGFDEQKSLAYPEGIEMNTAGGRIMQTQGFASNERMLESPFSLAGGTYYMSFLAQKSAGGAFKIATNNSSNYSRFSIEVTANGSVIAQSSTGEKSSVSEVFQNDTTQFVLVKFTNSGGNSAVTSVKVFNTGDQLPADDSNIAWDVESDPMATGVDQDRLIITIEDGTVKLDEILIGTSYKSVTFDEDYDPTGVNQKSIDSGELQVQYLPDGIKLLGPGYGGIVTITDILGRCIYLDSVEAFPYFIADSRINMSTGVKIIRYQYDNKLYSAKVIR
ncbi:MAG: hypothetical protein GY790_15600 [Bacteroidetes bacterium]|nr:hypothetical protein [Bacteroidota bacterium]